MLFVIDNQTKFCSGSDFHGLNTRNREQLLLLSFWTLSIVRISTNRKHNVSETGSVSVFRQGGATYSTEKPKACLSTGDAMFWHRLWKGKLVVFL
jgi:hypothetical protein